MARACGATYVDTATPVAFVTALPTATEDVAIARSMRKAVRRALQSTVVRTPEGNLLKLTNTVKRLVRDLYDAFMGMQRATKAKPLEAIMARARAMYCHHMLAAVTPMELAAFLSDQLRAGKVEKGADGALAIWLDAMRHLKDLVCTCEHLKEESLRVVEAAAGTGWRIPDAHRAAFGVGKQCPVCEKQPHKATEEWMPKHALGVDMYMQRASTTPVSMRHSVTGRTTQVPLNRVVTQSVSSWSGTGLRMSDGPVPAEVATADRAATLGDVVYWLSAVAGMCTACTDADAAHCKTVTSRQAEVASFMVDLGRAWPAIQAAWTPDGVCAGMPFTESMATPVHTCVCSVARLVPRVAQLAMATAIVVQILGVDCGRRAHVIAAFNVAMLSLDVAATTLNLSTSKMPMQASRCVRGPLRGSCPGTVCNTADGLILPSVLALAHSDVPVSVSREPIEDRANALLRDMHAPAPLTASTAVQVIAAGYGGMMVHTSMAHWHIDIAALNTASCQPPPAAAPAVPVAAPSALCDDDDDLPLDSSSDDGVVSGDEDLVLGDEDLVLGDE